MLRLALTLCFVFSTALVADTPRTDGPAGSEYGPSRIWEGELLLGARFGAVASSKSSSLMVGADVDYRPLELFGFQLSYHQALQKKGRVALLNFTPLAYWEYSNLRPYALFGPGLAFYKAESSQIKFSLNAGGGADFMLSENLGAGMNYTYHLLFDGRDRHSIGARLVFSFGR
jgi:hypothetical protein